MKRILKDITNLFTIAVLRLSCDWENEKANPLPYVHLESFGVFST